MNEIMKMVLSLSVSGTLLMLLILAFRLLFRDRFSRRWQYYIWLIAAVRFLFPFSFGTTVAGIMFEKFDTAEISSEADSAQEDAAFLRLAENETESRTDGAQQNANAAGIGAESKTDKAQQNANTAKSGAGNEAESRTDEAQHNVNAAENDTENKSESIIGKANKALPYLFWIWSAVTLAFLARKITIYQRFIRYIKAGNTEVSDIKTLNIFSDCKERLGIRAMTEIYRNPQIISPMMVGFFRPYIILPDGEFEDKELSYIFMHELVHCKQKDMFYKWLIQIVVCVHWFNPFVYLLEKEVNKACELSCDEKVISSLNEKAKREYGDTLISFMKEGNPYKSSLVSVTMSEGAKQIKERLGAIMNYKKKSKIVVAVTTILSVTFIACFFVAGAYAKSSVTKGSSILKDSSEILNLAVEAAAGIGEASDRMPSSSVSSPSGTVDNVSKDDYLPVASEYQFKQIQMFDENMGWALSKNNEVLLTKSGIKDFTLHKLFIDVEKSTDYFMNADFPDALTAYVTYFSEDTTYIVIEYTKNGGKDWYRTMIDYSKFSDNCDAGSTYISFADKENGYLLCCSTPAAGLMTKLLFRTTDGGKSFSFVSDLTDKIKGGYPQGITFNNKDNGYMAVSYHGLENAYLYVTKDGGRTWKSETVIPKNEDVSYIEAVSPPVFYGENKQKGLLVLKLAGENTKYVLLGTDDGGKWTQTEKIPLDSVVNYSAVGDKYFFFTDIKGNLYEAKSDIPMDFPSENIIYKSSDYREKEAKAEKTYAAKRSDGILTLFEDYDTVISLCSDACGEYIQSVRDKQGADFSPYILNPALIKYMQYRVDNHMYTYETGAKYKFFVRNVDFRDEYAIVEGSLATYSELDSDKMSVCMEGPICFTVKVSDGKCVISDWYWGGLDSPDDKYRGEFSISDDLDFWENPSKYGRLLNVLNIE